MLLFTLPQMFKIFYHTFGNYKVHCFLALIHYSLNYNLEKKGLAKSLLLTYQMQAFYLKVSEHLAFCCCWSHLQRQRSCPVWQVSPDLFTTTWPRWLSFPSQFFTMEIALRTLEEIFFDSQTLPEYSLLSLCSLSTYVLFVLYQFALVIVLLCKKVLQLLLVYVLLSCIRL